MPKHELWELQSMQAAPLSVKVSLTKERIRQWVNHYGEDGVYVSFSGGKDSTVLLHIVREMYPDIPAVFVDVPTQYPELKEFAKTFDNVEILKPKMNFMQVCEKYGFPLISKEVAECVQGARKYLTGVIESMNLDRPTDRYRTSIGTRELLEQEHTRSIEQGIHHPYQYETDRILGTCRQGEYHPKFKGGGTTTSGVRLEELANILNDRMVNRKGGQNQRLAIMFGMLTKDKNHPIKESIPKNDRSQFSQEKYSFFLDAPFEISNKCCNVMKKEPAHRYQKQTGRNPMTAQMAAESKLRTRVWLKQGCNAFDAKKAISNPMSFWTEQDVLLYIYQNHIPICSVYGDVIKETEVEGQLDFEDLGIFDLGVPVLTTTGCKRTGCMLCGFGCHLEKPGEGRFELLKKTHPKMYAMLDVVKNNGVTMREAIDWVNEHGNLNIRY